MATTTWNTTFIDGKQFLVIDVAKFRVPLDWDPSSNMFLAVAAPEGGLGNIPALLAGDDGATPDIDGDINFTALEWDDPTAESASFTELSPNLYQLNLALRNGAPGDDGTMVLDVDDYGTPVAGQLMRLNATADGFEYVSPKIGNRWIPASIAEVPTGNPAYTMATIGISAEPFDRYVEVEGQTVFTGTGADVRPDLVARMSTTGTINGETAGPIVGRGFGSIGVNAAGIATVFSPGPPAGSASTYDKILGGNTATVYVRSERQAGSGTYSTDSDTTWVRARTYALP